MASDTRLIKVFIPHTKSFKIIRHTDFCKYEVYLLPGVEAVLNGISKQIEVEEKLKKGNNAAPMLIQAFMAP